MRQRKPLPKKANISEKAIQEKAFLNLRERQWLEKQVTMLGRGNYLLKRLSVRTPIVKKKAVELTLGKTSSQAVRNIVNFASNIKFVETADITAARFYGRQTASDIISGKPIPTFRGKRFGLLGCQTLCAVTASLLRSAMPKDARIQEVRIIRTISPKGKDSQGRIVGMPHSIVSFKINGETYLADPFKQGYSFIGSKEVGKQGKNLIKAKEAQKLINQLKKQGNWNPALDPAQHGINTFHDYVAEARKYGGQVAKDLDLEGFAREMNY
jgi:hypothetical protein